MKGVLRIASAIIMIVLLFNLINWGLNKLIGWIADWQLLWLVIMCIIAYLVLVNIANLLCKLITIPVVYAESGTESLLMKWVLLILSWGLAIVSFSIIFHSVDFSITKQCVVGILAILINASIAIIITQKVKAFL